MAVNPDDVHAISIATVALYRETELKLLTLIAQALAKGMDAPTWAEDRLAAVSALRRAAQLTLGELEQNTAPEVRQHLAEAYRTGYGAAVTALELEQATQTAAQAATATVTRVAALESLASAVVTDIGERSRNVLRHVMDVYRSVVLQASAVGVAGGLTRRHASQDAFARFVAKGVTSFTDAGGRTWRLSSYVEMALRTVTQRAAVQGQTDRLESLGVDLVTVSDSPGECPLCRPWEGKVLSLGGAAAGVIKAKSVTTGRMVNVTVSGTLVEAMAAGLLHPNCTHVIRAYLPGATQLPKGDLSDPELNEAKTRQREIERKIRGWKEREVAALTPEAKTAATRKVRGWQGEMRQHLEDNPKLKRLPYRERIGAGNLPPKTGVPGRSTPVPPKPSPAAAPFHRHLDGIEDLATAVENGEPFQASEKMPGGTIADIDLITLADGRRVLRKASRSAEVNARAQADAEQLASLLGRTIGVDMPRVYRNDEIPVWIEYVDVLSVTKQAKRARGTMDLEALKDRIAVAVDSDQGRLIGVLDLMMANADRHPGNWLLDADRPIPVDHGYSWSQLHMNHGQRAPVSHDEGLLRSSDHGPFAAAYTQGGQWIDNDLTQADIAELRRRLDTLTEDFAHLGRSDWLQFARGWLDVLEPYARGTRNLVA